MKIVIIGAGSVAFTPAILSGLGTDARYRGATIGLVDVDRQALDLIGRFAARVSREFKLDDPHCADIHAGAKLVNESIDAQLEFLPRFRN
jgi:alpha-galactosidase/6-phospho-beta-glucosidase family protein